MPKKTAAADANISVPGPSLQELEDAIAAVKQGMPLSEELRGCILTALEMIRADVQAWEDGPGRKHSLINWVTADIAKKLVEKHQVSFKLAIYAIDPEFDYDKKKDGVIAKCFRDLNNGKGPKSIPQYPNIISAAEQRLVAAIKRKQ